MDELDIMEQRELERFAAYVLWGANSLGDHLKDHWQCVNKVWSLMVSQGWQVHISDDTFMGNRIDVMFLKPHYIGRGQGDTLKMAMLIAAIRAEQCPRIEEGATP